MFAEAMSPGHADFARRVARINSGAASSKRTLFVGMDESYVIPPKPGHSRTTTVGTTLRNALGPLSLLVAFGIGAVAHGLAMVARFHLVGLPKVKASPDLEMLTQFVLGFLLALVCAKALRMKGPSQQVARSIGVVAAVLLAHNLVHAYPEAAGRVFTPLWVADVVTSTKPHSILFRGLSFVY